MLFLYIDPSTGSMLFAVFISLITTIIFFIKSILMKIKQGGNLTKKNIIDENKKDIVIYSDHMRYDNVFLPILDEFEKRKVQVYFYTMSKEDNILKNEYKYIHSEFIENNAMGFAKINNINSKIFLSTTPGLSVYQWKKSPYVNNYVHIFHDIGSAVDYRMFGLDFYDTILSGGKFIENEIREIEEKRNLKQKQVYVVGSTYMDGLLNKYNMKNINVNANDENIITVLVAPSWGENCLLNKYGEELLIALEKTNYNVIIRPHPQMLTNDKNFLDVLMKKYTNFEWNFDNDNFDVLNKADIMISDFSGVIFDYTMVFNKPIIYAQSNLDKNCLDSCWLDCENYRYKAIRSLGVELKKEEISNIKSIIDETINSKKLSQNREDVKNTIWEFRGEATERTVDYLLNFVEKC